MPVLIVESYSRDEGGVVVIRGLGQLKDTMEATKLVELKRELGLVGPDTGDLPDCYTSFSIKTHQLLSILTKFGFKIVSQSGEECITWTLM